MKFMDLDDKYSSVRASVYILPVEYEGVITWGSGSDKGAQEILEASKQLEYYDEEFDKEACFNGIHTTEPLNLRNKTPEEANKEIKKEIQKHEQKFIITIGGDHSVGIACLQACEKPFSVLQFDAHPDLFYSWNGSQYNHRCFGHKAYTVAEQLVQVGIRSMDKDEKNLIDGQENITIIRPQEIRKETPIQIVEKLTKKVYISIDVDVFDPSFIRNTGTPEPNGLQWQQVINILKEVFKTKEVVGVNICEFSPNENFEAESYALAKLIYKIIVLKQE